MRPTEMGWNVVYLQWGVDASVDEMIHDVCEDALGILVHGWGRLRRLTLTQIRAFDLAEGKASVERLETNKKTEAASSTLISPPRLITLRVIWVMGVFGYDVW